MRDNLELEMARYDQWEAEQRQYARRYNGRAIVFLTPLLLWLGIALWAVWK